MKECLVIIDVQNGFIHHSSTKCIPQKIVSLVQKRHFDYIVCTQFINKEGSPFIELMGWGGLMDNESRQLINCIKEISSRVFQKDRYTCFTNEFEEYIIEKGIRKLYFVGVDTDCCVLKSATDCFERNIQLEVLLNYCASNGGEESHKAAIKVLQRTIGEACLNFEL